MILIKKIFWFIKITFLGILESLANILPEGSYGDIVRGGVLRFQIKKCGKKLKVSRNVKVINAKDLVIGDNVYLGYGSWINAKYGVEIEQDTMVGPYVIIASGNHIFSKNMMSFYGESKGGIIKIGKGCWIARWSDNNRICKYRKL